MTTITNNELTDDVLEYVLAVVEDRYENRKSNAGEDDRIILALRELQKRRKASKEPVRYLNKFSGVCVTLEQQPNASDNVAVYMPLYAAPPVPVQVDIEILASALKNAPLAPSDNQGRPRAPVVPPAIDPDYKVIKSILPTTNPDEYACCIADDMWNACRAAILQGGQPVSNRDELSSPVIPDGYALVPIVPTEDMVINGFESEPDPHFSDEKVWAEYEALSGCRRAARRAELCWAAMIKAAPKPEINNE
ncbi:TPA: hypothetical protein M8O99_004481 [Salmonella enterica subsp. enterica serovar Dublin]|nr:hypothetical protein [Salmonella enterica subsp. enterica serovar Dublin]HCC9649414.1 hypothetical protein [Salmonella enterica subsp. enterica serovar Dublin]HCC9678271.1 hypothetical protein [Salmonella enterica subsp. enterica serovar Dublin]HCC9755206.1 hypothetical protein [Salmonella enterica subsp. enterica serovar Dublin]HCC9996448.1 hypothetical protein [Salmonella enterica subsp. enterica serovar Dublin]